MIAHKTADFAASDYAVCLDGSPGMFYFAPARDAPNPNNWEIYFQGGGWCYDKADCAARAYGNLGSSTGYTDGMSQSELGGLMSSRCNVNPAMSTAWFSCSATAPPSRATATSRSW